MSQDSGVIIIASSPFFLRHALTLCHQLGNEHEITFLYQKTGPIEPLVPIIKPHVNQVIAWPQDGPEIKISTPWRICYARWRSSQFFRKHFSKVTGNSVYYEGDYPEPFLHSILAKLSRHNHLIHFGYKSHDIIPFAKTSFRQKLRIFISQLSWGYHIKSMIQPGSNGNHCLHFLDSECYEARSLEVTPDSNILLQYQQKIHTPAGARTLLLLESQDEEDSCKNYAARLNAILDELQSRGWHILAKGHPRLGNSSTVLNRGLQRLNAKIPVEMFDLSNVRAVVGICSSGMFSTCLSGIPTYSIEKLFERNDPKKREWSINFLTSDPGWNDYPIDIKFISNFDELPVPDRLDVDHNLS